MHSSLKKNKKGVATLMVVIVVVGVVLGIGVLITELSINELVIDFENEQSHQLMQIADACAEEAYFRTKRDSSYTGGTLTFDNGECAFTVSGSGNSRTINIEATVDDFTRDFTSEVDFKSNLAGNSTGIDLTDWEEE